MAKETLFNKIRDLIGGIAWRVYLWSARMSEEEFLAAHERQALKNLKVDAGDCTCGAGFAPSVFNIPHLSNCPEWRDDGI